MAAAVAASFFSAPLMVSAVHAEAATAVTSYRVVASNKVVVDSHAVAWQPDKSYARGGSV